MTTGNNPTKEESMQILDRVSLISEYADCIYSLIQGLNESEDKSKDSSEIRLEIEKYWGQIEQVSLELKKQLKPHYFFHKQETL